MMMNVLGLSLVLTSLAAAGIFSPNPRTEKHGATHGSHGGGDIGELRSGGGTTEFDRRDDTEISSGIGEKTSRIERSHGRFDRRE